MLTPLSPNVLGYDATPIPTAVELYKLLDAAGAEVTFTPFTMTVDGDGVFWGTLDGACVPLANEGETWSLLWKTTLAGYEDPIYDRQTLLVGFESTAASLCTLAQVKERLGLASTAKDANIATLIAALTPILNARYEREFMQSAASVRTFAVRHRLVSLRSYDLRSASLVRLHPGAPSPTVLTAGTGYALYPIGGDDLTGTYSAVQLASSRGWYPAFTDDFGMASLEVTGAWGVWATVADVPLDINQAAVECIISLVSGSAAGTGGMAGGNPREDAPAIPRSWDVPFGAHQKFMPYSRRFGVY